MVVVVLAHHEILQIVSVLLLREILVMYVRVVQIRVARPIMVLFNVMVSAVQYLLTTH
jgi:hypothetical protein